MSRQDRRNRFNAALFPNNEYTAASSGKDRYPANAVELIHEEVDTLAVEMPGIIEERLAVFGTPEFNYAMRLKKVGMTGSVQYTPYAEKIEKYEATNRTLEVLHELQQQYPLRKFVVRDDLETLMKKWEMVMAPMEAYMGEIPEKNLKEIEAYAWVDDKFKRRSWMRGFYDYAFRSFAFGLGSLSNSGHTPEETPTFKVIAFPNQINTAGLVKRGNEYYPKDPIIICDLVQGICEIVTKWGPEAADPIVVNEKLN